MGHFTSLAVVVNNKTFKGLILPESSRLHHSGEGMAAGAQGNWSLCLQSGSREMNAGTLLAFSFLFSPEPQLIHGATDMQYGPSHLIQPNPEMLLLDDSRFC